MIYNCKGQDSLKLYPTYEVRQIPCLNYLRDIKKFWERDSIGANGFRLFILEDIIGNCSPIGKKWEDISYYLGKPNKEYENRDCFIYEYYLSDNPLNSTKRVLVVFIKKTTHVIDDFRQRIYDG